MKFFRPSTTNDPAKTFEQLITPHVLNLYRAAFKLAGSQADAEDIVQEVLIKLYPRLEELQKLREIRPWLYRVLYNQFIDHRRKQSRSPSSDQLRDAETYSNGVDGLTCTNSHPEAHQQSAEDSAIVLKALDSLSKDRRALIVLHLVEGFTLEELSKILDTPLGTLKSRLHRTKADLKAQLKMELFEPFERDSSRG